MPLRRSLPVLVASLATIAGGPLHAQSVVLSIPSLPGAGVRVSVGSVLDAVRRSARRTSSSPSSPASSAAGRRVLPTAERYLGVPYVWGGTSPSGFDCSGFVQYVFARHRVELPRTSATQARTGIALRPRFSHLAPGDLVMFAEQGRRISHVAIYAGDNRIIHSSRSGGGVRYDDLDTERGRWFVRHAVAARRVTPDARGLLLDLASMFSAAEVARLSFDAPDHAPPR